MKDDRTGWYSDPWGEADLRYYDGVDWTDQVASRAAQTVESTIAPTNRKRWSWTARGKRTTRS
jgi:hypothetical protein